MTPAIVLSAAEAAALRDAGEIVISVKSTTITAGTRAAILEPWYRLRTAKGAYIQDGDNPRYIREADATASPLLFHYEPAETMPPEAVKRWAKVHLAVPQEGHILLYIVLDA